MDIIIISIAGSGSVECVPVLRSVGGVESVPVLRSVAVLSECLY